MKHQLVGYNKFSYTKKDTNELKSICELHFVRKPDLTEPNAQGSICVVCPVSDEAIKLLPELKVGSMYECDISSYRGFNKLRNISLI